MNTKDKKAKSSKPGEEWIDRSIREARSEQIKPEPEHWSEQPLWNKEELINWTSSDVTAWLESKDLHRYVDLFQKHSVVGRDLANVSLPFLENFEEVTLEERELLLSEIYRLHNPTTIHASEEDLTRIRSPVDRQKYLAAMELAQDQGLPLPRSSSVLVLPSQYSSRTLPNLTSPKFKPRHKSESGADPRTMSLPKFEKHLLDAKRRKTAVKTIPPVTNTIYDMVQHLGPHCVQCLQLSSEEHSEIVMTADSEGHVTVESVPDSLSNRLHPGCRVLEINGHTVRPHLKDHKTHLAAMLNYRSPATLVILSEHLPEDSSCHKDEKWESLHSLLVGMRDAETLPVDIPALPTDQEEYLKHTNILQEEIRRLEEKVREQQKHLETQQMELEDKEAIMHDLEVSRDKAIEKLKQTRSRVRSKGTRENIGGNEYFNMTMESLNLHSASKDEVVDSLGEIVKEASKQKWYLDRLISLVIEESPWLLDEVDTEFDNLAVTDQTEEFC